MAFVLVLGVVYWVCMADESTEYTMWRPIQRTPLHPGWWILASIQCLIGSGMALAFFSTLELPEVIEVPALAPEPPEVSAPPSPSEEGLSVNCARSNLCISVACASHNLCVVCGGGQECKKFDPQGLEGYAEQ